MSKRTPISFTRQQLYDEVWKYSVRGVSKKHDIPYGMLMKRLKEANIPYPFRILDEGKFRKRC